MISDIPIGRASVRSAVLSSIISLGVSKLAIKSVASVFLTGLLSLPHNQAAKAISQVLISWLWVPTVSQPLKIAVQPARTHHKTAQTAQILSTEEARRLYLHSFEKEYICVFTGKVTCGAGLCNQAEVQVHLASQKNPDIMKSVSISPDGNYEVRVPFKASLHENMDWWIIANSPESASMQIQGREILMDDSRISIEEPIGLL